MKVITLKKRVWEQGVPELKGARFVAFSWDEHGRSCRNLLNGGYSEGGGEVLGYREWKAALESDQEFDPSCCFVVERSTDREVLGFAHCWNSGFIKDIAVASDARRAGIGRALMLAIFSAFAQRGMSEVWLKLEADNPSGALEFYEALGMIPST